MVRAAAIAVSVALLSMMPVAAQAAPVVPAPAPILMRWKLALDLRSHPNHNPFASYLGGPAVWSLRESQSRARDGNYSLLTSYSPNFGPGGIKAWHGSTPGCGNLPTIGVNTGTKTAALCTSRVPGGAAFVRPTPTHLPVVAWTSWFKGTVSISHDAVSDIDGSCGDGVSYYVDLGTTELSSTRILNAHGTVLPVMSETVSVGQSLYFIVDPGPSDNAACDTTQLQVTIDRLT